MSLSQILLISVLFVVMLNSRQVLGQTTINCQRPPQLVDPALCCKDGGRDQVAEQCAQKILGAPNGQKTAGPPSLETAAVRFIDQMFEIMKLKSSLCSIQCLAECILTSAQYIQEPQKLRLDTIRSDLSAKFSNDSAYVEAMTMAFSKCEPQSQRRLATVLQQQQIQQPQQQQPRCSPFSAIVLGCTYMEYFKNCPEHRWTQSPECALAKSYVTQCGLGA
ncbi:hypothetical protein KR009_010150 [Drosophila setifemur]|nr:hypothetical protein KR009_010150 [Drosophila setifemur]